MNRMLTVFCIALCVSVLGPAADSGAAAPPSQVTTKIMENGVWYRLHLGLGVGEKAVTQEQAQKFIDTVITASFPSGLTVTQATGKWSSKEHGLVSEKTVVVDVQDADTDEVWQKVRDIARKYVQQHAGANASFFVIRVPDVVTTLFYLP